VAKKFQEKILRQKVWHNFFLQKNCAKSYNVQLKSYVMSSNQKLHEQMGLTQEEAAFVLNVSRSQFSKYEKGTRGLPIASISLIGEILKHIKTQAESGKILSHVERQQQKKQRQLQRMLKENKYQLLWTARKIEVIERKYAARINAFESVAFLENHSIKPDANQLKSIIRKATKAIDSWGLAVLVKYQIKLEVLQAEQKILKSKLAS